MKEWIFLTQERTGWNSWTRKRRNKFRRRYLRKHGYPFRLFISEFKLYVDQTKAQLETMILHVRE